MSDANRGGDKPDAPREDDVLRSQWMARRAEVEYWNALHTATTARDTRLAAAWADYAKALDEVTRSTAAEHLASYDAAMQAGVTAPSLERATVSAGEWRERTDRSWLNASARIREAQRKYYEEQHRAEIATATAAEEALASWRAALQRANREAPLGGMSWSAMPWTASGPMSWMGSQVMPWNADESVAVWPWAR